MRSMLIFAALLSCAPPAFAQSYYLFERTETREPDGTRLSQTIPEMPESDRETCIRDARSETVREHLGVPALSDEVIGKTYGAFVCMEQTPDWRLVTP